MTQARKQRSGQTGTEARCDPYGQPIVFNGKHATEEDYDGERVASVPKETDEELAAMIRRQVVEQAGARFGLPALVVLLVVLQLDLI